MHDDRTRVEARLRRFTRERLEPAVFTAYQPLTVEHWQVPDEPVPFAEAVGQEYVPTEAGWTWGRAWSSTWFRLSGTLPDGWDAESTEIVCDLGFTSELPGFQAEGLAYRPDGAVIKAVSPRSHHLPCTPDVSGAVVVYVEAAANPDVSDHFRFAPTPLGDKATAGAAPLYALGTIALARRDATVWELLQDVRVLDGLARELPSDSPRRSRVLHGLGRMLDVIDPDDIPGTAAAARAVLAPLLAAPAHASSHRIVAVGHAHIDSAWLWPVRETVRKVARTFANVLDLMDRHPEFVFAASSAQQYAWLKEHHPALFARVRERVREGRFVPVGGMWVESDTNMPGGESMIRQFSHGKRFFRDELGVETEEVWLPDSFGYSAALPQIVAGTGNRWFLTQKMSWNQVNRLPHHTFWWEGIDGTRLFTHLPPADTYSSQLTPDELLHTERNFQDAAAATMSLVPFGWGDGGGGPTREMLAAAQRSRDLEGLPRVEVGSPRRFFAEAEAEYPNAPAWSGEMYLELHRGTYTSQARTKRGNRRSEQLLHEAELWATTASVRAGTPYPEGELRRAWEKVLLLQFHDILPGSSIAWVHREAERDHAALAGELTAIIDRSLAALVGDGETELLANAAPVPANGAVAFGAAPPRAEGAAVSWEAGATGGVTLDNGRVRAVIDERGRIVSLTDAASGRDAAAPGGAANRLVLHRDTPTEWDAWDIDDHYRRLATPLDADAPEALEVAASADGTVVVTVARAFARSRLTQRISLAPGADAVDLAFDIDWHESQKLLKLFVDLDVHADEVLAETQFGYVRRATHENTSWDAARFEFCAHRWTFVGEPGYGVAVANDSTYGHDASRIARAGGGRATTLGLSLLRAPRYPDPEADRGAHTMRVSVRPGAGIREAVAEGYRLNVPPRAVRGARPVDPLFDLDGDGILAETVKLADDGSGDVVLRLYESTGGRGRITVTPRFDVGEWVRTDLLERPDGDASRSGTVPLTLRPFEIATLRFRRAGGAGGNGPEVSPGR
ncbi:glycoside hydrolase family 38 C-terminal domain-containing protein [Microbacterium sp. M3]|uniref:Glycoside hydrolase family 38 C-terminal domain-containing protein n=1 Tax=Microbacterium arthrosphaerae TaxID=792652 RepID=A0ABU4H2R9_9MICO|nr:MULTISPECIES: glycoside hydrolase family 38 C-terminal domain-containing protein [Microbacterium]MDW4573623.1 glycoside hydrolase family 38 C-terminal domain-containing protein [Microbacterium arthrosphaerae]MDW7607478.1 glycoside hydrolase family 38 C-terminal domain-containing protein [Microbacterium sp. M3]